MGLPAVCASALTVDIDVKETAGVAASGHPILVIVPLPEGSAHKDAEGFRILDGSGKPVPAQFQPLDRWYVRDNSIRNLQAQFLADVNAAGTARFTLEDKPQSPAAGLTVVEADGMATIVTGPLKFTVSRTNCRIVNQAWLDKDGDGKFSDAEAMLDSSADQGGVLTADDGKTLVPASALRNATLVVEEKGPIRAVIRVEAMVGPPNNPYGFKFRLYAYKGRSDIRLDYTLMNDWLNRDGQILYFDDFSLKFRPKVAPGQARVSYGNGSTLGGLLGTGSYLLQLAAGFTLAGAFTATGARAEGWIDASEAGVGGLQVVVKDFWQQYPKGLDAGSDGALYARLWPRGGEDGSGIYWLGDMQYKTHVVFLNFHKDAVGDAALSAYARIANRPPVPVLPAAWYSEARQVPSLMGVLPVTGTIVKPNAPGGGSTDTLGWRNWWNNGRKATITTGGTPLNWTADPFLISGDPNLYHNYDAWSRHSADIRPVHLAGYKHPLSRSWPGFVAGGYGWHSWRPQTVANRAGTEWDSWFPYDDQHAWVHEMETMYRVTGDRLLYDNLTNLGELFKEPMAKETKRDYLSPRAWAWIFELVRIQHSMSGDGQARDMMIEVTDALARWNQHQYLGSINSNVETTQSFQVGMIAHHLSAFYRELPEGREKRTLFGVLMGMGDYLTVHCWSDDNRGVGRRPTEKAQPYFENDDSGDIPALLYYMTGWGHYKEKTQRIASSLGAWWSDWRGARAGRMVSYVLKQQGRDTAAPAAVKDLEALYSDERKDLILLRFTAPARAQRYDVRFSNRTLVDRMASAADTATQELWWHARAWGDSKPANPGGYDYLVVNAADARTWNFTVRSFDAAGDEANLSAMSNVAVPKCCFDPDTLPAPVKARKAPAGKGSPKPKARGRTQSGRLFMADLPSREPFWIDARGRRP